MENVQSAEDYIAETDCMIKERIVGDNKHDENSQILKHSREEGHTHVWNKDFKVLGNIYCSAFKGKITETLLIKQLRPSLNV